MEHRAHGCPQGAAIVSASFGSSDYTLGWEPLDPAYPWEAAWIATDLQARGEGEPRADTAAGEGGVF